MDTRGWLCYWCFSLLIDFIYVMYQDDVRRSRCIFWVVGSLSCVSQPNFDCDHRSDLPGVPTSFCDDLLFLENKIDHIYVRTITLYFAFELCNLIVLDPSLERATRATIYTITQKKHSRLSPHTAVCWLTHRQLGKPFCLRCLCSSGQPMTING